MSTKNKKGNRINLSGLNPESFEQSNLKPDEKFDQKIQKDKLKLKTQKKAKIISDAPHPLDRQSGNGVGRADKKNGAGKQNWGTIQDDLRLMD